MIDGQMEIKVPIEGKIGSVADLVNYKREEISTFDRVMSQLNIAGQSDFNEQQRRYWQEAAQEKKLLSVLICEIDCYKEYVDNYGGQGASFMLLVVALALKNICEQQGCFLARYRQEGFAILIKGGDKETILEIAASLCKAVEESRTEHKYSKESHIVTLRVGISAIYPESMATLKSAADNALQNAKLMGRNQVSNDTQKREPLITETEVQLAVSERTTEKPDLFAPNKNESAPNRDKIDRLGEPSHETTQEIEKKPAAVRMYRGYAVDS